MRRFLSAFFFLLSVCVSSVASDTDSIPSGYNRRLSWHIGAEATPAYVPGTNGFLRGNNIESRKIQSALSGDVRTGFSFVPDTREGMLYRDSYQGIGIGANSFFANSLLGTPLSAYVYQGAPIVHFSERLWLGYEWRFGAAFGWKHYDEETGDGNTAVSTPVTAMLGAGVKLNYALSDRWQLSLGVNGTHYSNGNTSWPNAGVNAIGVMIGVTYIISPDVRNESVPSGLIEDANHGCWLYDIMAYGAWRKRGVYVGYEPQLCPGRFGVLGFQFSPLRKLNRYVAVGPALDMQWDESAGLEPYWVEGTTGSDIKFVRPPFGKQLSAGVSAHAELTMPIFSVNAGIGYDFISPVGEKRFYQSLTLKTFIVRNLYLNVGYRLGDFKDPQNLMLGVGVRL